MCGKTQGLFIAAEFEFPHKGGYTLVFIGEEKKYAPSFRGVDEAGKTFVRHVAHNAVIRARRYEQIKEPG